MPVQTGVKETKLLSSQRKRENQLIIVTENLHTRRVSLSYGIVWLVSTNKGLKTCFKRASSEKVKPVRIIFIATSESDGKKQEK